MQSMFVRQLLMANLIVYARGEGGLEVGGRVGHIVIGLRCHHGRSTASRRGVSRGVLDLSVPLQHALHVAHVAVVFRICWPRFDVHRDFVRIGLKKVEFWGVD